MGSMNLILNTHAVYDSMSQFWNEELKNSMAYLSSVEKAVDETVFQAMPNVMAKISAVCHVVRYYPAKVDIHLLCDQKKKKI